MAHKSIQEVKEMAEARFFTFLCLVNPQYQYGDTHAELCDWIQEEDSERKLALLPRGHLKSHIAAGYAAWRITKAPWITIVYLSAGEDLAKDQIYAIKNMMTNDVYRTYWPEMLHADEGQREQWSAFSFNVDHPERKRRGVRDHTIIVKTVKSNAIGLHCDLLIPDDVVIPDFADTVTGRSTVNRAMAQFTSILNPRGEILAVGTRYHPSDFYQTCIDSEYPVWDEKTREFRGKRKLWSVLNREVEDSGGDGTGQFLWPAVKNVDTGELYGFDEQTLAIIRADYEAKGQLAQFFCQYYNNPNAIDLQNISRGNFQYFDPKHISVVGGVVYFRDRKLNVFAGMDVAWTSSDTADYTAVAVIGIDWENNIYVLDLVQFKTSNFAVYYDEVIRLHNKWGFRKLRIETNAGGHFVKQELERMVRENGNSLTIDGKSQTKDGSKAERKAATLHWRYGDQKVWHFKGGIINEFEDQVVQGNPKHDDLVDAFIAAIVICKAPGKRTSTENVRVMESNIVYDRRFGGRRARVAA
jgi:predicted phage terminase large subunit-like protein